jgi:hypothetical protein
MKAPSTNIQAPEKLQIPNNGTRDKVFWRLDVGAWCFSGVSLDVGAWNLELL